MSERDLTPRKRRGLGSLLAACWSGVTRLFSRLSKRRDVDDILQEAFTRSYEIGGPSALRSYRAFLAQFETIVELNIVGDSDWDFQHVSRQPGCRNDRL